MPQTQTILSAANAAKRFKALDLKKVDSKVADELNLIRTDTDNFSDEEVFEFYAENFLDLLRLAEGLEGQRAALSVMQRKKSDGKPTPKAGGGGKKLPALDNGKSIDECEKLVNDSHAAERQARQETKLNDYRAKRIAAGLSRADAAKLTVVDVPKPSLAAKIKDAVTSIVERVMKNKLAKVKGLSNDDRAAVADFRVEVEKTTIEKVNEYARRLAEEAAASVTRFAHELREKRDQEKPA